MKRSEISWVKERIIALARLYATGTPSEMARRFELSERTIKRFIRELKDEGIDIRFDHTRNSYILAEN